MKLELGVPGAGTKVVINYEGFPDNEEMVAREVKNGLEVLKLAGDTWRDWSLEHETEEEKETRLMMEKNRMLQKQALERQNLELEQMLAGTTEPIGPHGRGS